MGNQGLNFDYSYMYLVPGIPYHYTVCMISTQSISGFEFSSIGSTLTYVGIMKAGTIINASVWNHLLNFVYKYTHLPANFGN